MSISKALFGALAMIWLGAATVSQADAAVLYSSFGPNDSYSNSNLLVFAGPISFQGFGGGFTAAENETARQINFAILEGAGDTTGQVTLEKVSNGSLVQLATHAFTATTGSEIYTWNLGVTLDKGDKYILVFGDDGGGSSEGFILGLSPDGLQGLVDSYSGATGLGIFSQDFGCCATEPAFDVLGTIAPVPEPATWAMLLVGFGGLGFMMRGLRRKPANALT
jgi:hypothetical protein